MKNLILAPANKDALIHEWLDKKEDRTFDLWVTYYDDDYNDEGEKFLKGYADKVFVKKGFKYPSAHGVITDFPEIFDYEYVWMPDDDILLNTHQINRMFEIFKEYDLWLGMPGIERGPGSHNTFMTQARQPANLLRYIGFIEVQCPLFSSYALKKCWNTFNESQSGWGIDIVWPALLKRPLNKIAVIDEIGAKHTRPVGGGDLYKRLNVDPDGEMQAMKKKYNVKIDGNTYGVIPKQ